MDLPAILERRLKGRRTLTGLLPGRLSLPDNNANINCKPIDISPHGLGLLTEQIIPVGTILTLTTHNQAIELEIVGSKPDFGKKGLLRYSLVTVNQELNLEEVFEQTGCLK